MDREITKEEQTKGVGGKMFKTVLAIGVLALAYWGLQKLITKTADAKNLRIAIVERGMLKSTMSAAGTIVAASERVINSPVTTTIDQVLLSTGAQVNKGDIVLKLDQEYTKLEFEQLKDQLALRQNNIEKLKLEFDKNLRDLDYQDQIKGLQLSELEAQLSDQRRLLEVGGATAENVETAELQLQIARIEKKKLENELQYRRTVNDNEKNTLQLEYNIQAKRLTELRRKLAETKVTAPSSGVITWINEDIGKTVTEGEPLVRIANLEKYRVEASTSDRNSKNLQVGMPVEVRIGKERLQGSITRILPEIENNTVKFFVALDDPSNTALRPNLRTELYIITNEKKDVLKLKRGNILKGTTTQYVYKVVGDQATKTRITKGLVSSDYFEIVDGLDEGDRVVISETEDFDHMKTFTINK